MSGQLWSVSADGAYLYSDQLSDTFRMSLQPTTKFRQLCDGDDATDKGLHAGDLYRWNVGSNVATQGRRIGETQTVPQTQGSLAQRSLQVFEFANSVPYSAKLDLFAKQDVVAWIDKMLKDDARKCFDIEAFLQFKNTKLRAAPTSGNNASAITLDTNGTCSTTNNLALGTGHVKAIVDTMKERNIPAFEMDDYACVSHVSTFRSFRNSLESINQYTDGGVARIMNGEIGRYEGCRFAEQNQIPKGGAADSTTFDPWASTADGWNNALSSWAFFFGRDTAMEAIVVPEEIRAAIPGDFGRARAMAWYAITGFGITHDTAADSRIVMWDSAA
jgi:hypothetical protein